MRGRIRVFLLVEAAAFAAASLAHSGVLVHGYEHPQARVAEGVIAVVLLAESGALTTRPAVAFIRPTGAVRAPTPPSGRYAEWLAAASSDACSASPLASGSSVIRRAAITETHPRPSATATPKTT